MGASSYTLLDVLNIALFRVGDLTARIENLDQPAVETEAMIECVNEVIRDIARIKGIPNFSARGILSTVARYDTGTASVAVGGTTVTGVNTVWTDAMVGRAFWFTATPGTYRIASVLSPTSLVLDRAWSQADPVTGQGYVIAQDLYELPEDFSDFIGKEAVCLEGSSSRRVELRSPTEVDSERYTWSIRPAETGTPRVATVYDRSDNGLWRLELDPYPDSIYDLTFRYRKSTPRLKAANEIVPIPDESIGFLLSGVVALWRSHMSEGGSADYLAWKETELRFMAVFDSKVTDEVTRFEPDNQIRERFSIPRNLVSSD